MDSVQIIKIMFDKFTKYGLTLYRFTMIQSYGKSSRKPVVIEGVTMINEPVVVRVTRGWESEYETNYLDLGLGKIEKMEALTTLEEIIAAGPEYLREFLGVTTEYLCKDKL